MKKKMMLMCLRLKVGTESGWEDFETKQMTLRHTQEKKEVKSLLPTQLPKLDLEKPAPARFLLSPPNGERPVVLGWHVRLPESSFGLNWGWEDGVGVLWVCSFCKSVHSLVFMGYGSSGLVTVVTHVGGSGKIRYPLANGIYFGGQKSLLSL